MDDIWGAYALQQDLLDRYGRFVVYNKASVYQERNPHDLTIDMEQEMIGYKKNIQLINEGYKSVLPAESSFAYNVYKNQFKISD
jgi:hypothetical protein